MNLETVLNGISILQFFLKNMWKIPFEAMHIFNYLYRYSFRIQYVKTVCMLETVQAVESQPLE